MHILQQGCTNRSPGGPHANCNRGLCSPQRTQTINTVAVVRDLGVWLDNELSVTEAARHQGCRRMLLPADWPRRLRQIRRHAGREVTTQLVLALVTSRLDYCNSLLSELPNCTLDILQRFKTHKLV